MNSSLRRYPKPLPKGCDYQGRFPAAAHAATDIGADDGQAERFHVRANSVERTQRVIFGGIAALLVAMAVVALVARVVR